jgi:ABC-type transporter Mla MlaB component
VIAFCKDVIGNQMALRIAAETSSDHRVTLSLEGSVMGPSVAVLQTACEEVLSQSDQLTLDLGGISFIDPAGVVLLRTLLGQAI